MSVVWKRPVLQCAVLAAVWSVTHSLAESDVEGCNIRTHKRRDTVSQILNFKAVVMKCVGETHSMKILH
jgi:hypothetical protein